MFSQECGAIPLTLQHTCRYENKCCYGTQISRTQTVLIQFTFLEGFLPSKLCGGLQGECDSVPTLRDLMEANPREVQVSTEPRSASGAGSSP